MLEGTTDIEAVDETGSKTSDTTKPAVSETATKEVKETTTEGREEEASKSLVSSAEAEEDKAETEEDVSDDKETSEAPEDYGEFTVKEGQTLDKKALEKFIPIAKKLGLSKEKAQELVELQADIVTDHDNESLEAFKRQQEEWTDEIKKDSVLGGNKHKEAMSFVAKARDKFFDKEDSKFFDKTGFGNYPGFVRALYKIGKAISEDVLVPPDTKVDDPSKRTLEDFFTK
jgi:hypothetical protein